MSKAKDSYSKSLLHQRIFRMVICIFFCLIALLPFVLLVMNATRDSESIKAGVSLIPSTHLIENWKNLMIKQNGMQITPAEGDFELCNHYHSGYFPGGLFFRADGVWHSCL